MAKIHLTVKIALLLTILIVTTSACRNLNAIDTRDEDSTIITLTGASLPGSCGEGLKLIKRIQNVTGKISYNSFDKVYQIVNHVSGTIDAANIGFVCNLPDELKREGLSVTLDGEYYEIDKVINTPRAGGHVYYYLQLTKVQFNKE